jgi:hypothetical protein
VIADLSESPIRLPDKNLRRQIDRAVSRALSDEDFASRLLSDPTLVLGDHGCSPQQRRSLLSIQAIDLTDFARQAHGLFWMLEPDTASPHHLHLAAAARH